MNPIIEAITGNPVAYYAPACVAVIVAWAAAAQLRVRAQRLAARSLSYGILLASVVAGVHGVAVMAPLWPASLDSLAAFPTWLLWTAPW